MYGLMGVKGIRKLLAIGGRGLKENNRSMEMTESLRNEATKSLRYVSVATNKSVSTENPIT
jgi:hypothetical protein